MPSCSSNHSAPLRRGAGTIVIVLSAATVAVAEDFVPSTAFAPPDEKRVEVDVRFGAAHEFRSSLDDAGSVEVTRGAIDTSLRLNLAEPLSVSFGLGYRFDHYDFGGAPFPVINSTMDPWDDIHTLGFSGLVSYRINDTWTLNGGLFGEFSAERSASWSDAFSGGGLVSVTYRMGERGIIGAGVGMTSAIEDDAKFFPVFVLDLPLNDSLRLTTLRVPAPVFSNGIELVYQASPECELSIGARMERRRFRLNDEGSVADGIGEDRDIPVWIRASWSPTATTRLDLMTGVVAWREFGIADENGLRIDTDRGEPAFFVGAAFRMTF